MCQKFNSLKLNPNLASTKRTDSKRSSKDLTKAVFEEKILNQAKLHPNQSKYFLRQDLSERCSYEMIFRGNLWSGLTFYWKNYELKKGNLINRNANGSMTTNSLSVDARIRVCSCSPFLIINIESWLWMGPVLSHWLKITLSSKNICQPQ